ncbi:DUF4339 domain-containing protein [Akkermansiaceae bacterium]|nr:DUF4339 domain-containing protein [Akkermansiaceae bacterium]MDB4719015.1 DUF4339 domain-containing protein [Akkermansiaceae bacterium]MDB4723514.1 DUF4339 domain-containing protein [Akkermansiaceae bacterium]MDC0307075.1 DUF4339 domain-containing protein [Akkermansiaceae bacterium]
MTDWFYGKGNMQYGPFDEATLRSRIATGEIAPQDFVWREGMESWKPLQEVRDLYSKETAVPDLSDEKGFPRSVVQSAKIFLSLLLLKLRMMKRCCVGSLT